MSCNFLSYLEYNSLHGEHLLLTSETLPGNKAMARSGSVSTGEFLTSSSICLRREPSHAEGVREHAGVSSVSRNGAACFGLGTKPNHGGPD